MASGLSERVQDTTITSGSPVTLYQLQSTAIAGRQKFSDAFPASASTPVFVVVCDNSTPVKQHVFFGTYNSPAQTISVVATFISTNWPSTNVKNVYCTPVGDMLAPFLLAIAPGAAPGILCAEGVAGSVVKRSFVWDVDAGVTDDFVVESNGNGAAGNIRALQKYRPVRGEGGTDAQRTIDVPTISGGVIKTTANDLEFVGPGGLTDHRFRSVRVGVDNYSFQVRVAGAWIEVFTTASFTYNKHAIGESNQATVGGIQADTLLSIDVPSGGVHKLSVFGTLHYQMASMISGASGKVTATIEEKVGAGSMAPIRSARKYSSWDQGGQGVGLIDTGEIHVARHLTPTPGTTYQFQLTPSSVATGGAGATFFAGSGGAVSGLYTHSPDGTERHSLAAILTRIS
jgi:hypothetical protein